MCREVPRWSGPVIYSKDTMAPTTAPSLPSIASIRAKSASMEVHRLIYTFYFIPRRIQFRFPNNSTEQSRNETQQLQGFPTIYWSVPRSGNVLGSSHYLFIVSHRFLVRSHKLIVSSEWISIQLNQKILGNDQKIVKRTNKIWEPTKNLWESTNKSWETL